LLVLLVVLVLVIFFLSPRDPELIFNSASGVSLSFAPFKLSLKVPTTTLPACACSCARASAIG
jgi:hypothetical protein